MATPSTSSTQNVKIGVCKVTLDGTDLGYTKGGVDVEVTTDTHAVNVDQFGNTPISEYIMGRKISVTCPLAETTVENLKLIMPGTTVVTEGTGPTAKKQALVQVGTGINLLNQAKKLVLHPIGLDDADQSEDLVIPLAATAGALKFAYKVDDERVFNAVFNGYPDPATKVLFTIGPDLPTP
ncbi:hypothetical protein [Dyella telluris]|uniref:Uncharacterized protein n=1 Tax=Dyella telluris TaxID=2763498 RepID=A0A7G8Q4F7_9GAMM|nr:hypothetical protein [Dyella telluris]QNK01665.1 hypothetical protein H8F01_00345 [Dyella telluris]